MTDGNAGDDGNTKDDASVYARIRDLVRDENTLYNQRIIWLITMQAFLYATLALLLQASLSEEAANHRPLLYLVFFVVAVTGVFVSLTCSAALRLAVKTLDELGRLWDSYVKEHDHPEKLRFFPHPKGRQDMRRQGADGNGCHNPRRDLNPIFRPGNLPRWFILSWIAIFIVVTWHFQDVWPTLAGAQQ